MLSALYYPFSRCIDGDALRQLLLVFDQITFLDPVDDEQWRAKLFRDLEKRADPRFKQYRDLVAPIRDLHREGILVRHDPINLRSLKSPITSEGALADLQDSEWRQVASNPAAYNMPFEKRKRNAEQPTWQIFPQKLPPRFIDALLSDRRLATHVIESGGSEYAWTVSYEAGSAASLNLHLAAAGELDLSPVTDSALHHQLLVRKLARSLTSQPDWADPEQSAVRSTLAKNAALQLVRQLLPRSALGQASFDEILRFRERTKGARTALVTDIEDRLADLDIKKTKNAAEAIAIQKAVVQSLQRDALQYRNSLAEVRDSIWPKLVESLSAGSLAGGGVAALSLQVISGGPLGVLVGSVAGAGLMLVRQALELKTKVAANLRTHGAGVAYLSTLIDG